MFDQPLLMSVLCMVSSVMTLSAISCDRFLAVICPLRTRVTQRKARYDDNDNHVQHMYNLRNMIRIKKLIYIYNKNIYQVSLVLQCAQSLNH